MVLAQDQLRLASESVVGNGSSATFHLINVLI